jgi:ergothioneine biosynthesis protein EgtB
VLAKRDVAIRHEVLERIADARERSDALFQLVRPDALYERPIAERHRLIFYIGHLEAFDWNLLRERVIDAESFHPEYDRLFAFGIDPTDGGLPTDRASDWPRLTAVNEYVRRIRATVDQELEEVLESAEMRNDSSLPTLLNVAIEHRLMHVETLGYLLHQLPYETKVGGTSVPRLGSSPVVPKMVEVPAGPAMLGLSRNDDLFGWDNEYEKHVVDVPAFKIDQFMITNGQYLEFMKAGGYEKRDFWNDADWEWKSLNGISHPVFWKKCGEQWLYRSMFEEVPLSLEWPVYVSHAEATAYARWAGKALPTEEEWHRAAYGEEGSGQRSYPWGNEPPSENLCNADFAHWDPTPVNALPRGQSAFGVHGMVGNGWEWTSTPFAPFHGFTPFSFYPGYSANFFDGKHFVIKGGSPRTAACMLRPTFRNWFQPHYQYVYAGFRCVSR